MTEVKDIDREAAASICTKEHIKRAVLAGEADDAPGVLAFAVHREAAEKAERNRIVAWIRAGGANVIVETHPAYLRDLAGAIERGEHLK